MKYALEVLVIVQSATLGILIAALTKKYLLLLDIERHLMLIRGSIDGFFERASPEIHSTSLGDLPRTADPISTEDALASGSGTGTETVRTSTYPSVSQKLDPLRSLSRCSLR
ncbi:hypothetical protein DFO45_2275 [Azorhizobium sp. AG788]|nr:hypothetical protein DFO45_2275 [Azorhizobium sp. AG788]